MNPRQKLKWDLIDDPSRRIVVEGAVHICEGQGHIEHRCKGGVEMNEAIFTRNHIKHLPASKKAYFWHEYNCSLNCTWFHRKHGHSSKYREWWISRVGDLYGIGKVLEWIERAPLQVKR